MLFINCVLLMFIMKTNLDVFVYQYGFICMFLDEQKNKNTKDLSTNKSEINVKL